MNEITHFNEDGRAHMVDVTEKEKTKRKAIAGADVYLNAKTLQKITDKNVSKGDVFAVAEIAGIMAAKRTAEMIPLCHPVFLSGASITFTPVKECGCIKIEAMVSCTGETGVEMEALTAVSMAALTIYDMCKSIQRDITISNVRLLHKSGGKSGIYQAPLDPVEV
ncbi:MAG: cyclic pyranopterin monophosphate synthase MoaC [Clostridiales Family XIII bacterium]|jgi:cyclic pyranopterin phosphate synthase|nr:cyclic pyranopterin monophosphate synthase MoaC [Clostridiales Family XIII bacterium]